MNRVGVPMVSGLAAALTITVAPAQAEEPVVPRPNAPCAASLANAWTWNNNPEPNAAVFTQLVCENSRDGYVWKVMPPSLPSTKWLTLGYDRTGDLRSMTAVTSPDNEGRYMLMVPSKWVGMPQAPDAHCSAELQNYLGGSQLDKPTAEAGTTGQPLTLNLPANLYSVKFMGYCLWTQLNS